MSAPKEVLRKFFPHLAEELEEKAGKVTINSIRSDVEGGEAASTNLSGYDPDIIDFIRRCDNEEEAEEIISFMEKRGEITRGYADSLRNQLRESGVRSFGSKKEADYYFKRWGQG
ncbi:MAG: DUF2095 family protein [Candidatus Bathyarchaeia archaeon]